MKYTGPSMNAPVRETTPIIQQAMRQAIREVPKDFKDAVLPFTHGRALQTCPGLHALKDEVQEHIGKLRRVDELTRLKETATSASAEARAQTPFETVQNSFGILSKRQEKVLATKNTAEKTYEHMVEQSKEAEKAIADAIVRYVRETFVPSQALLDLEDSLSYFAHKLKNAPTYEECAEHAKVVLALSPSYSDDLRALSNEYFTSKRSLFLSGLVHKIARMDLGDGTLSLTSRDGQIEITMGQTSPLLDSLKKTALDYSKECYSHRRALLATAFLSALAMEEERISRHYKLVVGEVQNALGVDLPRGWFTACWNAPCRDLWTERGSLALLESADTSGILTRSL